jgi:hypothetical protein
VHNLVIGLLRACRVSLWLVIPLRGARRGKLLMKPVRRLNACSGTRWNGGRQWRLSGAAGCQHNDDADRQREKPPGGRHRPQHDCLQAHKAGSMFEWFDHTDGSGNLSSWGRDPLTTRVVDLLEAGRELHLSQRQETTHLVTDASSNRRQTVSPDRPGRRPD